MRDKATKAGNMPLVHDLPEDELTQHEIAEALRIMRAIKRDQKGYMLVSPTVGSGRGLFITGPLHKKKCNDLAPKKP